MPIITLNLNSNPRGRPPGIQASTVPTYTPRGMVSNVLKPLQIVGLVPLICPDQDPRLPPFSKCDCREWTNDDCYINPVFASLTDSDPLKNDSSMFLTEFPFFYVYQWNAVNDSLFTIQEWDGSAWITTTTFVADTYGTYYNFQKLCVENWKGIEINWRKILIAFGEGLYRVQLGYSIFGKTGTLVSEPYCLKEWSCKGTDVTVRWEASIIGGRIGSIVTDCAVFDFCCLAKADTIEIIHHEAYYTWEIVGGDYIQVFHAAYDETVIIHHPGGAASWRDQIRVYAFFGKEKTEYERINVEYQKGEIVQVRNEAIQKFEYESALQPKWVHDRLKAYAFMADELYATDYNWNNSDYEIDKKAVTCDGSYEPEYNENTRYSNVKVQFKERCQNVIRDRCCTPLKKPST